MLDSLKVYLQRDIESQIEIKQSEIQAKINDSISEFEQKYKIENLVEKLSQLKTFETPRNNKTYDFLANNDS